MAQLVLIPTPQFRGWTKENASPPSPGAANLRVRCPLQTAPSTGVSHPPPVSLPAAFRFLSHGGPFCPQCTTMLGAPPSVLGVERGVASVPLFTVGVRTAPAYLGLAQSAAGRRAVHRGLAQGLQHGMAKPVGPCVCPPIPTCAPPQRGFESQQRCHGNTDRAHVCITPSSLEWGAR